MRQSFTPTLVLFCLSILCLVISVTSSNRVIASEARIAVASNFNETLKLLAKNFAAETGHKITIIPGSTGKLFAQIKHGAPFDAFFSADIKRAKLLEQDGLAHPGSRFTFAIGKIILWSPDPDFIDPEAKVLKNKDYRYLALANPKLAPYGKAAQDTLEAIGLWKTLLNRIVQGENISQTYQFVKSGNAKLGFVAMSQVKKPGQTIKGSYWLVPQSLYTPVEQQAVQLKDNPTASKFLSYVQSDAAVKVIQTFGYDIHSGNENAQ